MTIDEAIEHAKEVARTCDDSQCAADHAQLAEWLRQARGADEAGRWYTSKIRELESENARLRSCLSDDAENARQIMGENERLRELVLYMHRCYVIGHDWGPWGAPEKQHVEGIMRELGIEVEDD